jgi:hypothetical protein
MAPSHFYQMTTERGDEIIVTKVDFENRVSFLLSINDADNISPPVAELTAQEMVTLAEEVIKSAGEKERVPNVG